MILVHFEDLEMLLMTSKMCIVLCSWSVLPCPSLPQRRAHRIFVYFVLQKNYHTFRCPLCWRLGAYAPSCLQLLLYFLICVGYDICFLVPDLHFFFIYTYILFMTVFFVLVVSVNFSSGYARQIKPDTSQVLSAHYKFHIHSWNCGSQTEHEHHNYCHNIHWR